MSTGRTDSRFVDDEAHVRRSRSRSPPQVLLDRERCVLCQRCTRFSEQIAGDPFIDLLERGAPAADRRRRRTSRSSRYFSGNTIQICPVGALTSAAYRFRSRPFDLRVHAERVRALRVRQRDAHRHPPRRRACAGWPATTPRSTRSGSPTRAASRSATCTSARPDHAGRWSAARRRAGRDVVDRRAAGRRRAVCSPPREGGGIGVLAGGRLTVEDAYAYAKFARVAAGTNDIDFRARPQSARGAGVPRRARRRPRARSSLDYARLEAAPAVLLRGAGAGGGGADRLPAAAQGGAQAPASRSSTSASGPPPPCGARRRPPARRSRPPGTPDPRPCPARRPRCSPSWRRSPRIVVEARRRGDPGRRAGRRGAGPVLGRRRALADAHRRRGRLGAAARGGARRGRRGRAAHPAAGRPSRSPTPRRAPRSSRPGGSPTGHAAGHARPRHRRHPRRRRGWASWPRWSSAGSTRTTWPIRPPRWRGPARGRLPGQPGDAPLRRSPSSPTSCSRSRRTSQRSGSYLNWEGRPPVVRPRAGRQRRAARLPGARHAGRRDGRRPVHPDPGRRGGRAGAPRPARGVAPRGPDRRIPAARAARFFGQAVLATWRQLHRRVVARRGRAAPGRHGPAGGSCAQPGHRRSASGSPRVRRRRCAPSAARSRCRW